MKVVDKVAVGIQAGAHNGAEKLSHVVAKEGALATTAVPSTTTTGTTVTVGSALGGVGIAAAISAMLAQVDYEDKKRNLKRFYREEIASVFDKTKRKVKNSDVDQMAKHNHTINEQMHKNRRERLLNVGTIFAATSVALGVVMLGMAAQMFVPLVAFGGSAALIGEITTGVALEMAVKGAVGLVAYSYARDPIQKVGEKLLGLNKTTGHELIKQIHKDHSKGDAISEERVFEVFVHANPELDKHIKTRYGRKFDELSVGDKEVLTETIGTQLGVKQMTDDINQGRVKAHELAFAVEGKMSGVLPKEGKEDKQPILMTIKERLHNVGEHFHHGHPADDAPEKGFVQRLEESRAAEQTVQR